jgi:hypothetical protein
MSETYSLKNKTSQPITANTKLITSNGMQRIPYTRKCTSKEPSDKPEGRNKVENAGLLTCDAVLLGISDSVTSRGPGCSQISPPASQTMLETRLSTVATINGTDRMDYCYFIIIIIDLFCRNTQWVPGFFPGGKTTGVRR